MGNKIGVLVGQGLDVLNFFKDATNLMKDESNFIKVSTRIFHVCPHSIGNTHFYMVKN